MAEGDKSHARADDSSKRNTEKVLNGSEGITKFLHESYGPHHHKDPHKETPAQPAPEKPSLADREKALDQKVRDLAISGAIDKGAYKLDFSDWVNPQNLRKLGNAFLEGNQDAIKQIESSIKDPQELQRTLAVLKQLGLEAPADAAVTPPHTDVPVTPLTPPHTEVPVAPVPPPHTEVPVAPAPPPHTEVPVAPVPPPHTEVPVAPVPPPHTEVPVAPAPPPHTEVPVAPVPPPHTEVPVAPVTPPRTDTPVAPAATDQPIAPAKVTDSGQRAALTTVFGDQAGNYRYKDDKSNEYGEDHFVFINGHKHQVFMPLGRIEQNTNAQGQDQSGYYARAYEGAEQKKAEDSAIDQAKEAEKADSKIRQDQRRIRLETQARDTHQFTIMAKADGTLLTKNTAGQITGIYYADGISSSEFEYKNMGGKPYVSQFSLRLVGTDGEAHLQTHECNHGLIASPREDGQVAIVNYDKNNNPQIYAYDASGKKLPSEELTTDQKKDILWQIMQPAMTDMVNVSHANSGWQLRLDNDIHQEDLARVQNASDLPASYRLAAAMLHTYLHKAGRNRIKANDRHLSEVPLYAASNFGEVVSGM